MPRFRFDKLVRDKIIDHQMLSGVKPIYSILTSSQLKQALIKKIKEEAEELAQAASGEEGEELADVQQVLDDLITLHGLSKADVRRLQLLKNKKNGSFKKGIYVDYVNIKTDNPWFDYYTEHYKEI
jgi:predicted house-cleaning noncanonical NTP pyrophosphatase (MazG superfamily)